MSCGAGNRALVAIEHDIEPKLRELERRIEVLERQLLVRYEDGVRDGLSRANQRPGDGDMGG